MNFIKSAFIFYKRSRNINQYKRGFEWALCEIFIKDRTTDEICSSIERNVPDCYQDSFDKGAERACKCVDEMKEKAIQDHWKATFNFGKNGEVK